MRKAMLIAAALAMLFGMAGCQKESEPHYYEIEEGVDAFGPSSLTDTLNYSLYINREMNAVLNLLEGHMARGRDVVKGSYDVEDELVNVDESLTAITEVMASVEALLPPNGYEDKEDSISHKLISIKDLLYSYQDVLTEQDMEGIQNCVDMMGGQFADLKSRYSNAEY